MQASDKVGRKMSKDNLIQRCPRCLQKDQKKKRKKKKREMLQEIGWLISLYITYTVPKSRTVVVKSLDI